MPIGRVREQLLSVMRAMGDREREGRVRAEAEGQEEQATELMARSIDRSTEEEREKLE